jgi:hypothetical protein
VHVETFRNLLVACYQDSSRVQDFTHYVYFHCHPKIHQRLLGKANGLRESCIDILLRITPEAVKANFRPPSLYEAYTISIRKTGSESWLATEIRKNPRFVASPTSLALENDVLVRSPEVEALTWNYFRIILENILNHDANLHQLRQALKTSASRANAIHDLWSSLNGLSHWLFKLSKLVTSSSTFWLLLRNAAIKDAWDASPRVTDISPSTATDDARDQDSIENIDDYDATDSSLEDSHDPTAAKIRHWCKLICHFPLAHSRLLTGKYSNMLRSRQVRVVSLDSTLEPFRREVSLEAVLPKILQKTFAEKGLANLVGLLYPDYSEDVSALLENHWIKVDAATEHAKCRLAVHLEGQGVSVLSYTCA